MVSSNRPKVPFVWAVFHIRFPCPLRPHTKLWCGGCGRTGVSLYTRLRLVRDCDLIFSLKSVVRLRDIDLIFSLKSVGGLRLSVKSVVRLRDFNLIFALTSVVGLRLMRDCDPIFSLKSVVGNDMWDRGSSRDPGKYLGWSRL